MKKISHDSQPWRKIIPEKERTASAKIPKVRTSLMCQREGKPRWWDRVKRMMVEGNTVGEPYTP